MAAIVFDLDGTLIDSAPDIQATANAVLKEEGHSPLSLEETRCFIGNGAAQFVTRMCDARDVEHASRPLFLARFLEIYERAVDQTEIYAGAKGVLSDLKAKGHGLALCTNKPMAPCKAVLAHLSLDTYFDVIVAGDSLPERKPDPAPLLLAASSLGQAQACFVGDSEVDGQTAANAGLPFFLFTEGYRKVSSDQIPHQAAFSHFGALPELVADLFKPNGVV